MEMEGLEPSSHNPGGNRGLYFLGRRYKGPTDRGSVSLWTDSS